MTKTIRCIAWLLSLAMLALLPHPQARAEENTEAREISGTSLITDHRGFYRADRLFDGETTYFYNMGSNAYLTLEHEEGIGSVYLIFGVEHGAYTVISNDTGQSHTFGEHSILHDFLDLEGTFGTAPKSVTLAFNEKELLLNEIRVFTSGRVPDSIQRWEVPKEGEMDLILFSTHGDDEQLFFAGLLPYYAKERDYQVLVVYMTSHRNYTKSRVHEMLDGLWAVGVTNYPVLGEFPDFFADCKEDAYSIFSGKGITEEDITRYVVENIRRYKPKVAVGHDPLGEYSHGQHMVYSEVLQKAVQHTMHEDYFPESAQQYGLWDVPKTYLHLYEENPIFMNWDQPLASFGGMTAFEVTKYIGFPCHASQVKDFNWYLSQGQTAAEIRKYNPCAYGLFRSTLGEDVQKNDFFENLLSYEEERLQAEEAARLEAERIAQEEARKKEEEEAKLQEQLRLEAERKAAEEQLQAERIAQEQAMNKMIAYAMAAVLALLGLIGLFLLGKRKKYIG